MKRYVLYHPELGVFLDTFAGMGDWIWSKIDSCGHFAAVTFETLVYVEKFIEQRINDPVDYRTFK